MKVSTPIPHDILYQASYVITNKLVTMFQQFMHMAPNKHHIYKAGRAFS